MSNHDQAIRSFERDQSWEEWLRACLRAGLIKIKSMAVKETACEFSVPRQTLFKALKSLGYNGEYYYCLYFQNFQEEEPFTLHHEVAISLREKEFVVHRFKKHHKLIEEIFFATELDPERAKPYLKSIPEDYKCASCKAHGIKLWRDYHTENLRCAKCACKQSKLENVVFDKRGRYECEFGGRTDQIGWFVPAVPTQDNKSYWGYTSVPTNGCEWWANLPLEKAQ